MDKKRGEVLLLFNIYLFLIYFSELPSLNDKYRKSTLQFAECSFMKKASLVNRLLNIWMAVLNQYLKIATIQVLNTVTKREGKSMVKKMLKMILLVGMGMVILAGCNPKRSKEFIEGKAAELSRVYPTENLEDLFDKFSEGFYIQSDDLYDYKEGEGYSFQSIKLKVDSETKSITGTILWKKVTIDDKKKKHTEVLYEGEVIYQNGTIQLKDSTANVNIKHPTLLLQKFIINKESLSALKMDRKSYSNETGSAYISYFLTDSVLNNYIEVEQNTQLKMVVYIMRNTLENKAFNYTVDIQNGQNSHAEIISGK